MTKAELNKKDKAALVKLLAKQSDLDKEQIEDMTKATIVEKLMEIYDEQERLEILANLPVVDHEEHMREAAKGIARDN